jgi:uncharacterized protein (DUF2141 family)
MTPLLLLALSSLPRLTVNADGFTSTTGHALARLYLPGMKVTGPPSQTLRADIVEGRAHFEFEGLPPGEYAVVVVHDLDDNGEITHTLGFPSEPLGFSGGFRLGLFSGMPTFEKLRFVTGAGVSTLSLSVH